MSDVVGLAIVGAGVSVLVQFIKNIVGTSRLWTIAVVVALSMVAGIGYTIFTDTVFWQAALQILLYANAVYGFIIKSFEV